MRQPRETTESWREDHEHWIANAAEQARLRDMQPHDSVLWRRYNDGVLRSDRAASYAFRKMHESIVRNGGSLSSDVARLYPDLTREGWTPATKVTWGLYKQRVSPKLPPPARAAITGDSITTVPLSQRTTRQTYEHLFTYWTLRVKTLTSELDSRLASRDGRVACGQPVRKNTHTRIRTVERALSVAQANVEKYAKLAQSRVPGHATNQPDSTHRGESHQEA